VSEEVRKVINIYVYVRGIGRHRLQSGIAAAVENTKYSSKRAANKADKYWTLFNAFLDFLSSFRLEWGKYGVSTFTTGRMEYLTGISYLHAESDST